MSPGTSAARSTYTGTGTAAAGTAVATLAGIHAGAVKVTIGTVATPFTVGGITAGSNHLAATFQVERAAIGQVDACAAPSPFASTSTSGCECDALRYIDMYDTGNGQSASAGIII